VSAVSTQPAIQNNHTSPKAVSSSTQFQSSAGAKVYNSKLTSENKMKPDSSVQAVSKCQPTLLKTCSPPITTQQSHITDTNPPEASTNTFKEPSKNESTKTIDVPSLLKVLEDTTIKEEKSGAVSNDISEEKPKSNADQKPQSSSNFLFVY
jgi:hypothetical protein